MRLEDLNWMDVENCLQSDDRLMLVVGACEQHGHLSLLTDIKVPLALADAASQQTGVLVAPPLNFGISPSFAKYPGTIGLRLHTFLDVVEDLVRGLHAQGFKRLLFVNGHGGNAPAVTLLDELANDLPDLEMDWYSWWSSPSVTAVAASAGLASHHAGWIEAFSFCRVADLPAGEKPAVSLPRVQNADEVRARCGDGVFGGPYSADDSLMQRIFEAAVGEVVERLRFGEGGPKTGDG